MIVLTNHRYSLIKKKIMIGHGKKKNYNIWKILLQWNYNDNGNSFIRTFSWWETLGRFDSILMAKRLNYMFIGGCWCWYVFVFSFPFCTAWRQWAPLFMWNTKRQCRPASVDGWHTVWWRNSEWCYWISIKWKRFSH